MWYRISLALLVVVALSLVVVGTALADNPGTQGQPSQSCGSTNAQMTPGQSASAPGSAFNPNGVAGTQYAGQQPQNSNNPNSVSQYDVACFQVSSNH